MHILAEAESLGFQVGVLVAGHYPLIDHARAAVVQFNQREYSRHYGMLAWAFVDYLLVQDQYDCFRIAGEMDSGVGDLSTDHDHYLYRKDWQEQPQGGVAR